MAGRTLLCTLALVLLAVPAAAEDEELLVPKITGLELLKAEQQIKAAGFKLGRVYELARKRVLDSYGLNVPHGFVFRQRPSPGARWDPTKPIDVIVSAPEDGELPPRLPGLKPLPAPPPAPPPPADVPPGDSSVPPPAGGGTPPPPPPPPIDAPLPVRPQPAPQPSDPAPANPQPADPAPANPAPADPPPVDRDAPPLREPQGREAIGSPDAPQMAPEADPKIVPPLTGLELAEAEQLVRDAKMTLYVERVAGHPVGRVLEQDPLPRSARPAGGIVKIVVTAGGDFTGATPSAPEIYVPNMTVPDLLDRTELQAERIIGDLKLVIQKETAKRGLAGRVVDQMPAAGSRVPKGGVVRVWIGPEDAEAPAPAPPFAPEPPGRQPQDVPPRAPEPPVVPAPESPPIPEQPPDPAPEAPVDPPVNPRDEPIEEPQGRPMPDPAPKKPVREPQGKPKANPNAPLAPGPLPGAVPVPIAPQHGAVIPRDELVPIGFSWKGVKRASHYILEVEEEGAQGRWIANVRKPARKTACIVEVERLSTSASAKMRWRVRAVIDGRESSPSKWVVLK